MVGPGNRPLVIARDGGGGGFLSAGSPFQGSRRVRAVARFQTSLVESGSAVRLVVRWWRRSGRRCWRWLQRQRWWAGTWW